VASALRSVARGRGGCPGQGGRSCGQGRGEARPQRARQGASRRGSLSARAHAHQQQRYLVGVHGYDRRSLRWCWTEGRGEIVNTSTTEGKGAQLRQGCGSRRGGGAQSRSILYLRADRAPQRCCLRRGVFGPAPVQRKCSMRVVMSAHPPPSTPTLDTLSLNCAAPPPEPR
jgi:hypothetical protein